MNSGTGDVNIDNNTLYIDNSLNRVGIGTSAPGAKLEIDDGTNTEVIIESDATGASTLSIYGSGQGTGRLYVGQTASHGGGIEYNGDGSPSTTGAGSDYITLWRRDNGYDWWTARNKYNSNDWEFRGNVVWAFSAGNIQIAAANTERSTYSMTPTKVKEIVIGQGGTIRVSFKIKRTCTGFCDNAMAQVYKNNQWVGYLRSTSSSSYVTYSQDIPGWSTGDLCQLYIWIECCSEGTTIKDFQISVSEGPWMGVTLD